MSQDRDAAAIPLRHPAPSVIDMTTPPPNRTAIRLLALASIALIGTTALGGCTLRLADPDDTSTPVETGAGDETGGPEDGTAVERPETDGDGSGRETAIARADQTIPCSPGLDVSSPGTVIRVEGACEALTVSADAAVVVADDVQSLVVTGTGTVVHVLELGDLRITGDANVVSWTGTTPSVADSGTANLIGKDIA